MQVLSRGTKDRTQGIKYHALGVMRARGRDSRMTRSLYDVIYSDAYSKLSMAGENDHKKTAGPISRSR
jgi:hypothetical protein